MTARYGTPWTHAHGASPRAFDAGEWAEALGGLSEELIRRGFMADMDRGSEYPPSSARFRAMCLAPRSDAPRTYLGPAPIKRARTALESDKSRMVANRELAWLCEKLGINADALTKKAP